MALKVIGAGFGRTGTLSLKNALEMLGLGPCYHMMEVKPEHVEFWRQAARGESVDWEVIYSHFESTVDWPSCNWWAEQLHRYPDAKVILSLRDPEAWYKSIMNTIYPSSVQGRELADERFIDRVDMAFEVIWDGIFEGRMADKAHVIDVFNKHNQQVIDTVPPEQLLVYQPGDGWSPLCEFLSVPEPSEAYPRVNSTDDFQARMKKARAE